MIRCAVPLTAVVLLALASCDEGDVGHHDVDALDVEVFEITPSRTGNLSVGLRAAGGPIPLNEHFAIEVQSTIGTGAPVEDAVVSARCSMPEHGHGMNVVPLPVCVLPVGAPSALCIASSVESLSGRSPWARTP